MLEMEEEAKKEEEQKGRAGVPEGIDAEVVAPRGEPVKDRSNEEDHEIEEFKRKLEKGAHRRKVRMKPNVSAEWVKILRERYRNQKLLTQAQAN